MSLPLASLRSLSIFSALSAAAVLVACSSDTAATGPANADGGPGATSDAGSGDATPDGSGSAGPLQDEAEPNGGALGAGGTPETNPMVVPGSMRGAISPADDADIFSLDLSPGELWEWSISAGGSAYVPHVTVFDTAENNLNPTVLAKASSSKVTPVLQHFVLRPGSFVAAVRDARNVPAGSSAHVGSAGHTYALTARRLTASPEKATLPSTVSGKLDTVASVALYTFDAKKGDNIELVLKAARKVPASALDSRMSLFNLTAKTTVLTNDNAGGATSDSEIRGPMPADATYLVVIENEAPMVFDPNAVPDLSFQIELKLK